EYGLGAAGRVRLEIYNVLGQPVRVLVDEESQDAGMYQVEWDARDQRGATVAAGVYLTRLVYPGGVETRRLLYLK
ncbi:MAG: T9SS type A sorting domain-containing protein, partial [Gemmatimonadaceae bacterium]|nr:T9SS type A sorting domain-containing protein [Gemmatimonadaceae bacterium]